MKVELIDLMGSDLTVVNAARVSFNKESEWEIIPDYGMSCILKNKDEKLIKYLCEHNHWSPFAHPQLSLRISAPIFVARQLVKHQIGLTWNEVSRRYVDDKPEFYKGFFHKRADNKKQGSSDELVDGHSVLHLDYVEGFLPVAEKFYNYLLEWGVAPEDARMVLPLATYTEWIWTGSLYAFARVCNLRCKEDTQKATREVAEQIKTILEERFPVSMKYLTKENAE